EIFFCSSCLTGFVHPLPPEDELRRIYTLDYFQGSREKFGYADYKAEAAYVSRNFPRRLKIIESRLPGGRLLDIGCATGEFLTSLGPKWERHGIEVSKDLIARHGVPERTTLFQGHVTDFP